MVIPFHECDMSYGFRKRQIVTDQRVDCDDRKKKVGAPAALPSRVRTRNIEIRVWWGRRVVTGVNARWRRGGS